MEEHDRIELRSDDVQEIIGTPPRWIVRWGTVIVTMTVFAMVSMSFFVKYPDKVRGQVTVTSKVAAVRVMAQQSGRISKIFVEDGNKVEEGELLVIMQNAANYEDVDELEEFINDLKNSTKQELLEYSPEEFRQLELGSLQSLYSQLQTDFKNFQFTEMNQAAAKQVFQIKRQVGTIKGGIDILKRRLKDAKDNAKLEKDQYERLRSLLSEVSVKDVENQKKIYINAQSRVKEIESQINDKYLSISQLSTEIESLQNNSSETNNENYVRLENSLNNLIGEIDRWNEQNLLVAAMDGKVSMVENWSEKQYIEQGKEIMAVIPVNSQDSLFVQLLIPVAGSGKIEVGHRVLLKFDNYPYREFGQVDAEVVELPGLVRDNMLPVKIKLLNGLWTRSKKNLTFDQEMRGVGEIITEDRTVFERIFENVLKPLMGE